MSNEQAALNLQLYILTPHLEQMNMCNLLICGSDHETKIIKTSSVNWINLQSGIISSSISRLQRDHSICTAVMGCTACALLIVSGLASDRPIYLTFPSSTSFLSSPTYSNKMYLIIFAENLIISNYKQTSKNFKITHCRHLVERARESLTVSSMGTFVSTRCW